MEIEEAYSKLKANYNLDTIHQNPEDFERFKHDFEILYSEVSKVRGEGRGAGLLLMLSDHFNSKQVINLRDYILRRGGLWEREFMQLGLQAARNSYHENDKFPRSDN